MILLNVPIEPIEMRYSVQWAKWFAQAFDAAEIVRVDIPGVETSGKINAGSFLDVVETNVFKAAQLTQILVAIQRWAENWKENTRLVIFFHDLWFPGLEAVAYVREGLGIPRDRLKICGCLHAGSYDEHDFLHKTGMTLWAKHIENGWFQSVVDEIFVATEFHKQLVALKREVPPNKIHVTGFPICPSFVDTSIEKENIILFPHRLDAEKRPDLFDAIAKTKVSGWQFIKTKEAAQDKAEYYNLLNRAKIAMSFAEQETWGIAMQEAVLCGCVPLVPNRLSYTEMYPPVFRFETMTNAKFKLMDTVADFRHKEASPLYRMPYKKSLDELRASFIRKGEQAIPNIIARFTV